MKSLELETIKYINEYVRDYYYKAIKIGVEISDVKPIGAHLYSLNLGNATLTFMGTADGTAKQVGFEGDIF